METQRLTFRTPRGNEAIIHCRPGTNDAMVARSILDEDEYGMRGEKLAGAGLDIGAHIGAWSVAALLDNSELHVLALEPLAPNRELLAMNLHSNGLETRCILSAEALGKGKTVTIYWDYVNRTRDPELQDAAAMHRYIGNQRMADGIKAQETTKAPAVSVAKLVARLGDISVLKIDAEGAESNLIGAKLERIGLIVGEYHSARGKLYAHLGKTHRVTFAGEDGLGLFRAEPL